MSRFLCAITAAALFAGCAAEQTDVADVPASDSKVVDVTTASLTLNVPSMHCPHGCYPAVKEALESQDGVSGVDLVEQESEDEIDDHRVIVKLDGDFDTKQAIAALADAGFSDASVEE